MKKAHPRTTQPTTQPLSESLEFQSARSTRSMKRRDLASAVIVLSLMASPAAAQLGGLGGLLGGGGSGGGLGNLGGLLGGGGSGGGGIGNLGGLLGGGGIPGLDSLGGLTGGFGGGQGAGGSGGGGLGGLDDIGGLGGIGDFLGQFQKIVQDMTKQVLGSITGQLSKVFQGALGALGLPDLNKLSKDVLKSSGAEGAATAEGEENAGTEAPKAKIGSISGVNPVIYNENKVASLPARTYAAGIFSKENQEALSKEAEMVKQKISVGSTTVSAIGKLTQQSSSLSQKSAQTAKQAQSRISTQDAIKDLNTIQGNVSSQLEVAAGQFAGLSNIQSNALELTGIGTARLSQINLSTAGALQQLADVNDELRGDRQAKLSANSDLVNRLSSVSGGSFILLR